MTSLRLATAADRAGPPPCCRATGNAMACYRGGHGDTWLLPRGSRRSAEHAGRPDAGGLAGGRRGRARLAVVLGPPVRGPSGRRNARPLRGPELARRAGGRDQQRPHRVPRLLRRVPQPRPAREGRDHARPPLRRTVRAGPRRRLARAGGGRVRLRLPVRRHPARHARGGGPDDPVAAQRGAHDGPRHRTSGSRTRRTCRRRSGAPADLGRRHRQASGPCGSPPDGPTAGTPPTSAPTSTPTSSPRSTGGATSRAGIRRRSSAR